MGKVNRCLKWSYIIVASLIGAACALLLAATLFSHGYLHKEEEVENMAVIFYAMYVFYIITVVATIIGVYGACKQKKWALIVFAVAMILSSLYMIANQIYGRVLESKVPEEIKKHYLNMLPLSNASESVTHRIEYAQMEFQCCGLERGHLDWGYNISEFCLCTDNSTNPCVEAPRDSSLFQPTVDKQPVMVYEQPCLPYLIAREMVAVNSAMGVQLGITLFWVLSVVLCIAVLCQVSRRQDAPAVHYSQQAKAGNYNVLTDPAEFT